MDWSVALDELPSRPLTRDEIDNMQSEDRVDFVYPVYPVKCDPSLFGVDEVSGFVIACESFAVACEFEDGEWVLEELVYDSSEDRRRVCRESYLSMCNA